MKTLEQLQALIPIGQAIVVPLGYSGRTQIQIGRVIVATFERRAEAEYAAMLWNLMPNPAQEPEGSGASQAYLDQQAVQSASAVRSDPGAKRRRKAGKSVQVVP